jgi:nucleotide-binding universal stress UspA family protein
MILDKILVAVDFGEPSLEAARWTAQRLAPRAELLLAHCIEVPGLPAFLHSTVPHLEQALETLRVGATHRLEELRAKLPAAHVSCVVTQGRPYERLALLAADADADLLVVGEHAQAPGFGKLLGRVPEKLIQTSTVPVLLARSLPREAPRRILVAIDDSAESMRALDCALDLAELHAARLVVLHVVPKWYADQVQWVASAQSAGDLMAAQLAEAREWLAGVLQKLGPKPVEIQAEAAAGAPEATILEVAEDVRADLLVLGSRGGGGVLRPLVGSVARSVLRHGSFATLFVPAALR